MGPADRSYRPSKRLGQHFLKDPSIANRIVSAAHLSREDTVLEPGAGLGVLTQLLEKQAGLVIAVEKDPRLAASLRRNFTGSRSVEILEGDVLRILLPPFNRVVGTPPYYISSKLVLFLQESKFTNAHLVFQKEFGERLLAQPGTRDYGRLSITAQRMLKIETLLEIPRVAFEPRPKVDSLLVALEPKPYRLDVDREVFDEFVRGIYTQRRRLLRGALLHFLKLKFGPGRARALLDILKIPDSRVYELSISQLEEIAMQLTDALDGVPEPDNSNNILRHRTPAGSGSRHADN